jgi:SAM-dependent methyltransferase
MTSGGTVTPAWQAMTEAQTGRWQEVLDAIAERIPAGAAHVLVHGAPDPAVVADRLAGRLRADGRDCVRLPGGDPPADGPADRPVPGPAPGPAPGTALGPVSGTAPGTARPTAPGPVPGTVTLADGRVRPPAAGWDVAIRLGTGHHPTDHDEGAGRDADIVIDLRDRAWPVIRHITPRLAGPGDWHITESRAFFAARAAGWDAKFGDDIPAYTAAVAEAALPVGGTVLDAGCGTGRALPVLRAAVGAGGTVIGLDITPQMLTVARTTGRAEHTPLLLADARHIPVADASLDAVFAAGLVNHFPDAAAGLAELARVTRPEGRLAIFHPSGRAALAARHDRPLRPDDPLNEDRLGALLNDTGWHLDGYHDPPDRFLAVATRRPDVRAGSG